jgi:hypothetical protein
MNFANANNPHRKSGQPGFLHAALKTTASAAFIKESRMSFANANNLHRKSGQPGFLHAAVDTTASAAFIKESRMSFANANNLHRKSGQNHEQDLMFRIGKVTVKPCYTRGTESTGARCSSSQ